VAEDDKNMMRSRLIIVLAALCLLGAAPAEEKPAGSPALAAQPALASKVAVIPITGDIDYGLQKSLERRLDSALEQGASVIIFEMDSYGGGLDPGAEMADMILAAGSKVRTVAYVDKKAISADALISLACQQIIMRRGTTLGDCEAIMITQSQTMEVAPEKVQTFVRVLMRKYSKANGYPTALCEKMVDPDMEVYQCKSANGPVRYLSGQELSELKTDEKLGMETKLIAGKGKLLTMDDEEARAYGISRASVSSLDDAIALVAAPGAQRITAEVNWSEEMVRFLNSTAVSSLLMIIGTIAVYICFKTPGFGAPELVAIVCFGILFLSKYMVGLATVADILMFVAGLGLIGVEIFVWPGLGVLGFLGAICIIVSLVLAFQNFAIPNPKYDWQLSILVHNLISVFGSLLTATLLFMVIVRFLPKTPFLKKLVLATQQSHAGGYVVVSAEQQGLVGKTGRSMSMLRPSGTGEIGGETYPVITDGEFIEPGTPIVVAEVSGNRIVVRKKN
jgi:membrane-bound serine protease (ClpP class)